MSVLPITTVGDPVLRARAREVTPSELTSEVLQGFIDDLIETKRNAHGAGLAANQVGELRRVAIVEVEPGNPRYPYKPPFPLTVLVNPSLEPIGEDVLEINEGCLSVPGLRGLVARHARVRVRFTNRDGEACELEVAGLSAGTFQHEIDHLDGTLFLDRADPRSLMTWEQYDRRARAGFEAHARQIVERYGS